MRKRLRKKLAKRKEIAGTFYTYGLPDVDTTQWITSDEPVDLEAEIEKSKRKSVKY